MKPLTLFENQAARIVAACSNCLLEQLDPGGGSDQLPDFELRNPQQQRVGVLEVTSTVIGQLAAFERAQAKYKISDARLYFDWFLVTRSLEVNLKSLQDLLPGILLDAEKRGLASKLPRVLHPGLSHALGEQPQTALCDAGIWILSALRAANGIPGHVYISPPAQGGSIGPEMVTAAVQTELQRADNLVLPRISSLNITHATVRLAS